MMHLVHQIPFIDERTTITLEVRMATVLTASEKRKRLKLKRIVISEHNYLALKKVGYAGDSFNDVVSRLLQVYRAYKEEKKQEEQQQQQQENDVEKYITNDDRLPFPGSLSDLFDEHDRQQLADLLGHRKMDSSMKSQPIKEEGE
jgi:predicted CopG family antitoxin